MFGLFEIINSYLYNDLATKRIIDKQNNEIQLDISCPEEGNSKTIKKKNTKKQK